MGIFMNFNYYTSNCRHELMGQLERTKWTIDRESMVHYVLDRIKSKIDVKPYSVKYPKISFDNYTKLVENLKELEKNYKNPVLVGNIILEFDQLYYELDYSEEGKHIPWNSEGLFIEDKKILVG